MADEAEQDLTSGNEADTNEATETTTPTMEELSAKIEQLTKLGETQKNEIAGLNSANSTQKNAYDDLLKKTETEAETKTREAEELKGLREKEHNDFLTSKANFETERTMFNVTKEALKHGFTEDDITALGFSSVEQVQSHKSWLDSKLTATAEETTQNIQKGLSGENRQSYNSNKSEASFPSAIEKAFK